ncbi:uncharacterized protein [Triticum aestivum]|uniref:uncharacterized protein n=1 Tax=Triticum aestivum TaxID=4565 RepID=UPI00098B438D|nr:uncharacterized protein LOC109761112 [Aegilops tauschii subsp. strangulata]XP_044398904.1 uncharacterized protein LOC123122667 [Triticum aestivum]
MCIRPWGNGGRHPWDLQRAASLLPLIQHGSARLDSLAYDVRLKCNLDSFSLKREVVQELGPNQKTLSPSLTMLVEDVAEEISSGNTTGSIRSSFEANCCRSRIDNEGHLSMRL